MCLRWILLVAANLGKLLGVISVAVLATACAAPTVTPITPPPDPVTVRTSLPAIQFTIQMGAFSTPLRAARFAGRLQSAGLDAYYFIDSDALSKVRLGRFDTKQAARRRAAALQAQGLIDDFYIVRPGPAVHQIDHLDTLRGSLVTTARRFIGTPYRWGGASARDGFDCSGLTMTVYRLNGLESPRSASAQFKAGTPVQRRSLEKGDLVFFTTNRNKRISHVGIYSGQGKFIHAPGKGKSIGVASLSAKYFKARYRGARRFF